MRNHVVYSFFPKAVATKFTIVHDLNLKQISLISIVIFRFLKESLEVVTALKKNEYMIAHAMRVLKMYILSRLEILKVRTTLGTLCAIKLENNLNF